LQNDDGWITRREFDAFCKQYAVDRDRSERRAESQDNRQWLILGALFLPLLADVIFKLFGPGHVEPTVSALRTILHPMMFAGGF
jgi:hypothetical protein